MKTGEIVIYPTKPGETAIDVTFQHQMLWLSQQLLAGQFDKEGDTIGLRIKTIISEGESIKGKHV